MDVKAYIESGILEEYVLGTVSEQEFKEVRCLASIYPDIKLEIEKIEAGLIQFSEMEAGDASFDMEGLISKVNKTRQFDRDNKESLPIPIKAPAAQSKDQPKQPKTVPMPSTYRGWQVAAVVLMLACGWMLWTNTRNTRTTEELLAGNNALKSEVERLHEEIQQSTEMASIMRNEAVRKIGLTSVDSTVNQVAVVFWNTKDYHVYLDASGLPAPPAGKQYQLWILKDGTPIDQGIVPFDSSGITKMKEAQNADAFAITLEDEGGKPTPDLSQLKVMGK